MVYAWNNRQLSVGSVVALITLIDNAYTPIAILNVIYIQYKLDKAAWVRFEGLLDLKEDRQLQEGELFDAFSNEIRVENVSFSYSYENIAENIKKILNNVSLTIQKGQKVAFVGESGSGKSTLAKILIGLLKYESGEILIDDKPLKRFSLESLYEKVSYFSQDTPVFDGTIRENLVFEKEVLEDELHTSLENIQLLPLLAALDCGLDTRIGEKGACLSGGEKQRLALARLWFDHAEIVVLDEATSALDNVTEHIVMKNVLAQVKDAAVIAIAHRLTSIRDFDKIYVFREVSIVGSGTFSELLEKNAYFNELYQKEKNLECI